MDIKKLNEEIANLLDENNTALKVGDTVRVIDSESVAKGYKGVVDSIQGSTIKVKLPDGPEGNMKDKYTIIPFKDNELQPLTEEAQGFDIKVSYNKYIKGNLTFKKRGDGYQLFMPSKYDPLYEDFNNLKSTKFSSKEEASDEIKARLRRMNALNSIVESTQINETNNYFASKAEPEQIKEDTKADFEKVKQNAIKTIQNLSINSTDRDFEKAKQAMSDMLVKVRLLRKGY